jgi:transposase-like protein
MSREVSPGKPTTRRYSIEEKDQAVRLVFQLRKELGASQGTVIRVAGQLGYGAELVRRWVSQAEIDAGEIQYVRLVPCPRRPSNPQHRSRSGATAWSRDYLSRGIVAGRPCTAIGRDMDAQVGVL